MNTPNTPQPSDIPTGVTRDFLKSLEEQEVPPEVVSRLRVLLLSGENPSRRQLEESLFNVEPLP